MAPRSALANISFTVDSASEDEMARDDLNALPTPDSNAENKVPTRKPRGKAAQTAKAAPATKSGAKGKIAARRASGGSVLGVKKQNAAVAKKAGAKGGRKALVERQDVNTSDTEEVDEFEGEAEVAVAPPVKAAKRGRPAKGKKVQEDESVAEVVAPPKRTRKVADAVPEKKTAPKSKTAAKTKAAKRAPEPEPESEPAIPETQPEPEPMDVEESIEFDEIPETIPPPTRPTARRAQQQPRGAQTAAGARRAGSASDTERDPVLRRKLGEITKKLEAMTTKYENLKEVASSDRDANFDQLKKQTDATAKNQDAVIKALKQHISEIQSRTSDLTSTKKQLATLTQTLARSESDQKALKAELATLRNENQVLSSKLAAARSENKAAVPGSAVKTARPTSVVLPGTAEAAKEAQLRQLKIDLYSDLTNLVVVGIKKGEDSEDIYDCLQTGRNGTLHFQLAISASEDSYEDAQVFYTPQFDEKRDQDLLDLLPDYLTEDIEFPRHQVAKFYEKILDSMTKRLSLED